MRYRTRRTLRRLAGRSSGAGSRNGTPESRIVRLAREMRWAIVASGTTKARAICAVVRPPTARRVRATAEGGVSAGWQHRNSRTSVSSCSRMAGSSTAGASPAGSRCRATTSRSARDRSLRRWSISRRCAVRSSQPYGSAGTPSRGQWSAAARSASWTASSDASKSPERRVSAPRTRGARSRSRSSTRGSAAVGLAQTACPTCSRNAPISAAFDGASSMTWRTVIGCWVGTPFWPGTAESRAAISIARASDSTSTIW